MKRLLKSSMLGLAVAAGTVSLAAAQDAVDLRFATVGVGSAWYNYGAGIAEMVQPALPEGSQVTVMPVAGGLGNIKMIEAGETEFGLSFSTTTADACAGRGQFEGAPVEKLRGVLGGLDIYYFGTFVTASSGVESWEQIVAGEDGFTLLTASVGGTGELTVRQVLDAMGSSYDDVESKGGAIRAMDRAATASAIADGRADGWAHVVTKGHPAATELATSVDMKVVPLPEEVRDTMVERFGFSKDVLPANTFPGQTEDVATVKTATNIMASADVPEDLVYALTKTILDDPDRLQNIHAALADFDPESAADPQLVGNCPWHPGAERALKEAGLL